MNYKRKQHISLINNITLMRRLKLCNTWNTIMSGELEISGQLEISRPASPKRLVDLLKITHLRHCTICMNWIPLNSTRAIPIFTLNNEKRSPAIYMELTISSNSSRRNILKKHLKDEDPTQFFILQNYL